MSENRNQTGGSSLWPALPLKEWQDTYATLHMWAQIVGKVRLAQAAFVNHWWHVPLYVTCRGLTTSPIPYDSRTFQMDFDFIDHRLIILTSDGAAETIALKPQTVADFYAEVMGRLRSLGLDIHIWTTPVEVPDPIPFEKDDQHKSYDPEFAHSFWLVLVQASRVFTEFRGRFAGKNSPVHFFWGSFDLAVTRFSGRRAPPRLDVDPVTAESYTHEVSSCGFWPGGGGVDEAAFYAYSVPEPAGFNAASVGPTGASYNKELGEFVLPYEAVRTAKDPDAALLEFLQSSYEAGANLAQWPRAELEYSGLGYWERAHLHSI